DRALAYVWADRAADAIVAGKLVACLEDWCAAATWLYLYYPDRRHMSAGLRAVIDAMRV
ncbi:MAG: LysR family transcriptional regulator, partial [Proteobacteria bacterium]|nr:LysR family transcriptional regulator [Pseudomonadota bacterium]